MRYRILEIVDLGGAGGTGNRFQEVCIEGKYHAVIKRNKIHGEFEGVKGKVDLCTCDRYPLEAPPEARQSSRTVRTSTQ